MSLFKKKTEPEAPAIELDADTPIGPEPGTPFTGAGACFSEGFYYPVVNDQHGNEVGPDKSSPLVWKRDEGHEKGGYLVHAAATDANHFHTYGMSTVELEVAPQEEQD